MKKNNWPSTWYLFLANIIAILLFPALACQGAIVTNAVLNPIEDATVRAGFTVQKKNFGTEPVLELQSAESEAYLKFDLTEANSLLKQAKLRFYAGSDKASVAIVSVRTLLDKAWSESSLTWKTKPEQDATIGQAQLVGSSPAWYEVDVTSQVKAELAAGGSSFHVALVVSDGEGNKISINSREATENKPELVLMRSSINVRIVFRPSESGAPAGYLVDNGTEYGPHPNGFTYGWNMNISKYVADRTQPAFAVAKQSRPPDARYACVVAMDNPDLEKPAFWGISLPNGTYKVHVVAGDPGYYDSVYALNVNDVMILEGIPDQAKRWVEATKTIAVDNQKIIITNNPKGINNKLCFVEISEARDGTK